MQINPFKPASGRDKTLAADFFSNLCFNKSNFEKSFFEKSIFEESIFEKSIFEKSNFDKSHFWRISYKKSKFETYMFEQSQSFLTSAGRQLHKNRLLQWVILHEFLLF